MGKLILGVAELDRLTRLADVLIPGSSTMPSASAAPNYDGLLQVAVKACGYGEAAIESAIGAIPEPANADTARVFAERSPQEFEIVSVLASSAYLMAPAVLHSLGYPVERRFPAGNEDFADEYSTGILDAVTDRGSRYRNPGIG